jgi:hypothetical protein
MSLVYHFPGKRVFGLRLVTATVAVLRQQLASCVARTRFHK